MSGGAREQIVAGAADMLSRGGFARTSVRELAKHAHTPLGSTYHYFPEGKVQLAQEAVEFAGGRVSRSLAQALEVGPVDGLRALLSWWRQVLITSEFEAGCPVLSVAVTESRHSSAHRAVDAALTVFADWERLLTTSLISHGAHPGPAADIATLVVCAVEGSVALCRAEGSTRALDTVETTLIPLLTRTLTKVDDA